MRLLYCFLSLSLLSCKATPDEAVNVSMAELRKKVTIAPDECFDKDPRYCLDVADEVIAAMLKRPAYKGEIPKTRRKLKSFVRQAKMKYRSAQTGTDKNRALILEKVKKTFENPKVFLDNNVVYIDLGLVPNGFEPWRTSHRWAKNNDRLYEDFYLKSEIIARQFLDAKQKHPKANYFTMRFRPELYASTFIVSWFVNEKRIAYDVGSTNWTLRESVDEKLEVLLKGSVKVFKNGHGCTPGDSAESYDPKCSRPLYFK